MKAVASGPASRSGCAHAPCSAARWCTGCCNRCLTSPARAVAARRSEGVLALIEDTRFAALFAPGSRAEVSIVGRLDRPGRPQALVSGQIDRLVVTPSEVLIVDYKTNHAPPRNLAEVPAGYLRQLALYRAVLGKLYPQLPIRAALLWTETPELMEISAPALDAELASIIRGGDRA
jgi:ATP-dependent helicase/nuclease subunit A